MPTGRRGKRYEYNGQNLTVAELALIAGVDPQVMRGRLGKLGWSITEAVETPVEERPVYRTRDAGITFRPNGVHLYCYKGKKRTLRELSDISGIPAKILYGRIITRKWPIAKAVNTPVNKGTRKSSNKPQPRNVTHTVAGWGAIKHIA